MRVRAKENDMPLRWSIKDVTDWKITCFKHAFAGSGKKCPGCKEKTVKGQEHICGLMPATDCLIWSTMSTGIPKITEQNVDEFYRRVWMIEEIIGPMRGHGKKTKRFTRDEVAAHIGLYSNASPMTKVQFGKHVARLLDERFRDATREEKER